MKKKLQGWKMDTVFVMTVFCAFATLLLLLPSGSAYKSIAEKSHEGYDERTCLSYIWTKVKHSDAAGKVYIDSCYDLSVLKLEEEYDLATYETMIYLYDGWVRELFSEAGPEFHPEAGIPLFEVESLDFEALDGGLIRVTVNSGSLLIYPRGNVGLAIPRDEDAFDAPYPVKGGAGVA